MAACSVIGVLACVALVEYCKADNSVQVTISPKQRVIKQNGFASITCSTDQKLNGCQFKIREEGFTWDSPIIDTDGTTLTLNMPNTGASINYTAHKEPHEKCTFNLYGLQNGRYVVGCRLLLAQQWQYEFMFLTIRTESSLQPAELSLSFTNNAVVHKKGDTVTMKCKENNANPFVSCDFYSPNNRSQISFKDNITLQRGKCDHNIPWLEDKHNGVYWCSATTKRNAGGAAILLIVASEPTVNLLLDKTTYKIGDTLLATCTVTGTRLATTTVEWCWEYKENHCSQNFTRTTSGNDVRKEDWIWPWASQITNITTFNITKVHNGTHLFCRVTNDNWNKPMQSHVIRIIVKELEGTTETATVSDSNSLHSAEPWSTWIIITAVAITVVVVICTSLVCFYIRKRRRTVTVPSQRFSVLIENDLYHEDGQPVVHQPPSQDTISCTGSSEHIYDYAEIVVNTKPQHQPSTSVNEYEYVSTKPHHQVPMKLPSTPGYKFANIVVDTTLQHQPSTSRNEYENVSTIPHHQVRLDPPSTDVSESAELSVSTKPHHQVPMELPLTAVNDSAELSVSTKPHHQVQMELPSTPVNDSAELSVNTKPHHQVPMELPSTPGYN